MPQGASLAVLVAHFWVNRTLLALWTGKAFAEVFQIQQPNAGISVVDVQADDIQIGQVHVVGWQAPVADMGSPVT